MPELVPEEFVIHNQESLEDLAWELEASAGQFTLLLARCNYASLRSPLLTALQQICPLDLRVMALTGAETALYSRIQAELGQSTPGALMVVGLETVTHLEELLANANQVREEFRKNCPFPVVLWVTDDVQKVLLQVASDLESWATKTHFTLPPDTLHGGLQEASDRLFSALLHSPNVETFEALTPHMELGILKPSEVAPAIQELRDRGESLNPALEASLDLVKGLQLQTSDPAEALTLFEHSLHYWQQPTGTPPPDYLPLRQGLLLFYRGQAQYALAHEVAQIPTQTPDWGPAEESLRGAIARFEQADRPDLVVRGLNLLQRVLQKQQQWEDLERFSRQGLELHQRYGTPTRLSQDYGFLAKVALERQDWPEAKAAAQQALEAIANEPSDRLWLRGLYLLFLAQAERHMGNSDQAVAHLVEADAEDVGDRGHPKIAVEILKELRDLYYERQQYRDAFEAKQARLSIEQQYGIRAFVGAGRLQPRRQKATTEFQPAGEVRVAPEIEAEGRQQDLKRLLEWLGRSDRKLIVIHGGSGVGKSSLVTAGLVPALKQRAIGVYENLPVVVRQYTTWEQTLEQALLDALAEKAGHPIAQPSRDAAAAVDHLFEQLRLNERRNLRTVLIFDQFEEFFFTQPDPGSRLRFFQVLARCLQTSADMSRVKVILSLREDYLHYLLELNRLPAMQATGIDALSRNVLYELGNFAPDDARTIIQTLAERARFPLEPDLMDQLVADLAAEIGAVRPIEMQIVGAQIETEKIRSLEQYCALGDKPKDELVSQYLQDVVDDCGAKNAQLAELALYVLTDERGIRPLKTRSELERELKLVLSPPRLEEWHQEEFFLGDEYDPFAPDREIPLDFSPNYPPGIDPLEVKNNLDLYDPLGYILLVFCGSGIVVGIPDTPEDRYQLVHDYIAETIRQQKTLHMEVLISKLEDERKRNQQAQLQIEKAEKEKKHLRTLNDVLVDAKRRASKVVRDSLLIIMLAGGIIYSSGFYWFYTFTTDKTISRLRNDLRSTLEGAVEGINADELMALYQEGVPNEEGFSDDPRYLKQLAWFKTVKSIEPRAWLYSYIVGDPDENRRVGPSAVEGSQKETIYLIDLWAEYDTSKAVHFLESDETSSISLQVLHFDKLIEEPRIYTDDWGTWMSAFAPIKNSEGDIVAILGLDIEADQVFVLQQQIRDRFIPSFLMFQVVFTAAIYVGWMRWKSTWSKLNKSLPE